MGRQIAVAYTITPGRVLSLTLLMPPVSRRIPSEMSRLLEKGINPLVVKEASITANC